jgi:hypothetical protein
LNNAFPLGWLNATGRWRELNTPLGWPLLYTWVIHNTHPAWPRFLGLKQAFFSLKDCASVQEAHDTLKAHGRTYWQPSRKIPVSTWDCRPNTTVEDAFTLGQEDARQMVRHGDIKPGA